MSNVDVTPAATTKAKGTRAKKDQAIVPVPATQQEVVATSDTAALIAAITKLSRDTTINIERMQYLMEARRALLDEEAEQAFNDAMAAAQAEMEPISRDCENPQTRSKYSSYAALDRALRPIYTKYGFAIGFKTAQAPNPNDILVICTVTRGRHKQDHAVPMPCDGKGPRGNDVMTRTHAIGSAVTYGRRYTLCMAFNISSADDDGNQAGARNRSSYDRRSQTFRAPPANFVPAPPPPSDDERASHTRQAIEAATANARSRLLQGQLEASLAPISKSQLADLKEKIAARNVPEELVKKHFKVNELENMTAAQYVTAINKLEAGANGNHD